MIPGPAGKVNLFLLEGAPLPGPVGPGFVPARQGETPAPAGEKPGQSMTSSVKTPKIRPFFCTFHEKRPKSALFSSHSALSNPGRMW